jgi:hypothetical protein
MRVSTKTTRTHVELRLVWPVLTPDRHELFVARELRVKQRLERVVEYIRTSPGAARKPSRIDTSSSSATTGVTTTLCWETNGSSVQIVWTCGECNGSATSSFASLN